MQALQVYYANVLKEDVGESLNTLSEMLLNSTFDNSAIEREKRTILQEMEEVEKVEEEVVFDNLHYTAYQTSPLGRTILGTEDNIKNMTREQIVNYIQANYVASRMVVVAAGPVNHDEFAGMVEKAFAATPTQPSGPSVITDIAPAYFTGSDIRVRDDEMPLAHIATAWETVELTHPDSPATMVMQAMLGSFDSSFPSAINSGSRMVSILAGYNERQYPLVQSAMTFNTQYSDTGLFGVYYVTDLANIMEAQWAVMREFQELCHNASDEAVEIAKAQLKATIVGQLDASLSQVTEDIGRQLLNYGRRMHMAEMMARIDAVDAPTVRRVATSLFNDKCIAMSAKGNISAIPDYGWLRRHTWSLRY
jgi:processing peptidase subunit beta